MRGRGIALVLSAGLCLGPAMAGCGGGTSKQSKQSPSPHPTPTKKGVLDPLTGQDGKPGGPVVGVKIDDTAPARPQVALNSADLVYVELAEGGLTRLLAVYARHRPGRIGPVRSVRGSDPELMEQYGKVALAFSGGAAGELEKFHSSPLVDASFDAHPDAYKRDSSRRAPYNLFLNVKTVSEQVSKAAGVKDIGLRWSNDRAANPGQDATQMSVRMQGTPVSFSFDAGSGRWNRTLSGKVINGEDGDPVSTPNVLVQFCQVTEDTSDIDQAGNPATFSHTVGEGRAVLFRDGRRVEGTWKRTNADAPTRFTDGDGKDLLLRPGGAWILLAPTDSPLDSS